MKTLTWMTTLALALAAGPALASIPCDTLHSGSGADWERRLECGDGFGDNSMGASFELYGGVYAWERGADDKARLDGGMNAEVTIFGDEHTIVGLNAFAESTESGQFFGQAELVILDNVVTSRSLEQNLSFEKFFERDFFTAVSTFFAGPFTLQLRMGATGRVGASISGGVALGVNGTVTPEAGIYGFASIAGGILGGLVADAGVEVNLQFISIELPIALDVDVGLGSSRVDWSIDVNLVLSSLDGWVTAYVQAFLGLIRHEVTITEWDGLSASWTLFQRAGMTNL